MFDINPRSRNQRLRCCIAGPSDVFGNALGNSIVGQIEFSGEKDKLGQAGKDQYNYAIANGRNPQDALKEGQLADQQSLQNFISNGFSSEPMLTGGTDVPATTESSGITTYAYDDMSPTGEPTPVPADLAAGNGSRVFTGNNFMVADSGQIMSDAGLSAIPIVGTDPKTGLPIYQPMIISAQRDTYSDPTGSAGYGPGFDTSLAVPPGFVSQSYNAAVAGFSDPNNSLTERGVNFVLAGLTAPLAFAEQGVTSLLNLPNNASMAGQFTAQGTLATTSEEKATAYLNVLSYGAQAFSGALGIVAPIGAEANAISAADVGSVPSNATPLTYDISNWGESGLPSDGYFIRSLTAEQYVAMKNGLDVNFGGQPIGPYSPLDNNLQSLGYINPGYPNGMGFMSSAEQLANITDLAPDSRIP